MIYINKNQILGLQEEIESIKTAVSNLDLLPRSGGTVEGVVNSTASINIDKGFKISGESFYLDLQNDSDNKILIGNYSNQNSSGDYIGLYYVNTTEETYSPSMILESKSGNATINFGSDKKILINNDLSVFSNDSFRITNGTGYSLIINTGDVQLKKDIKIGNFLVKDIAGRILAGSGNFVILDSFLTGDFLYKKYDLSIYTRSSVKIKNITLVLDATGVNKREEQNNNSSELDSIYFTNNVEDEICYFKINNSINKSIVVRGFCTEYYK